MWALFEEVVKSLPNAPAVQFETSAPWSYEELHKSASKFAEQLQRVVKSGQHVAVMLERSPAQVASILAIAKIGAVYVPVDHNLPRTRVHSIVASVEDCVILCDTNGNAILDEKMPRLLVTGEGRNLAIQPYHLAFNAQATCVDPSEDDVAAVLFTSGSTGNAKGVQLTHRNLILPARFLAEREKIGPSSRVFQFARSSFDVHLIDIMCALLHGGLLLQVSQDKLMTDTAGWMRRLEVNTAHLTPSTISMLDPELLPALQYLVTCGEPVTRGIIDRFASRVVLTNLYGPCEASSVVAKTLRPGDDVSVIGRPSPHASVVVITPGGYAAAEGTTGEIVVKGGSVFKGYSNRDVHPCFLDAVLFPGMQRVSGPWYCTGDYGYVEPTSGNMHLVGRMDDQVKVNGQRVELGDIEAVVSQYVGRCTVLAHSVGGRRRLFAVVSRKRDLSPPEEDVRRDFDGAALEKVVFNACSKCLPPYMIPRTIAVQAIPQSPSGKIDAKKIRSFIESLHQGDAHFFRSAHDSSLPLHQRITALVSERLRQHVPRGDSLLEWGFTSVDATALIKSALDISGREIRFRDFMADPSIDGICRLIESAETREKGVPRAAQAHTAMENSVYESWYRPTLAQESLFRASQMCGHHAYICSFAFEILSPIDVGRLIRSVESVYGRHDAFNTSFSDEHAPTGAEDPCIMARVRNRDFWARSRSRTVSYREVEHLMAATQKKSVADLLLAAFQADHPQEKSLDLAVDPPAWMTLYAADEKGSSWLAVFKFHHLVIDLHSFQRFWSDVITAYRQGPEDFARATPTPPLSFRHFAEMYRAQVLTRRDRDMEWWTERARNFAPEPILQHADHGDDDKISGEDYTASMLWQPMSTQIVAQFLSNRPAGTTAFGRWLGLCQIFVYRLTGASRFLMGVPGSVRTEQPRFSDVVGYGITLGVLPVSIPAEDHVRVADFLNAAARDYWDCHEHDQAIEDVVRCFPARPSAYSRVTPEPAKINFQFAYEDGARLQGRQEIEHGCSGSDGPAIVYKPLDVPPPNSHYALVIHVDDSAVSPRVGFHYQTRSFDERGLHSIIALFEDTLAAVTKGGNDLRIRDLRPDRPLYPVTYVAANPTSVHQVDASPSLTLGTSPSQPSQPSQPSLMQILKECWADILGGSPNSLQDDRSFFRSGGDSISVIRFCSKARAKGVVGCTVGKVYASPTLAQMAKAFRLKEALTTALPMPQLCLGPQESLQEGPGQGRSLVGSQLPTAISAAAKVFPLLNMSSVGGALEAAGIAHSDVEAVYPATPMQSAMIWHMRSTPGTYVVQHILRIEGSVNCGRLEKAWERVVAAHPALRTVFVESPKATGDTSYFGIELKQGKDSVVCTTLQHPLVAAEMEDFLLKDRQSGFPVASKTACRLVLVRQSGAVDGNYTMILTMNHASIDGWSVGKILADLQDAYEGIKIRDGSSFSPNVAHMFGADQTQARVFWQSYLSNALVPKPGSGFSDEYGSESQPVIQVARITPENSISANSLRLAASALNTTPFTVVQCAFSMAISCRAPTPTTCSTKTKVMFWTTISGRGYREGDAEAVGNFINTIPCVVHQPGHDAELRLADWLRQEQDAFGGAVTHSHFPVSETMSFLNPGDATVNALLVFSNQSGLDSASATRRSLRISHAGGHDYSNVAYTVVVTPTKDKVEFLAKYDARLVSEGEAMKILARTAALVNSMVSIAESSHNGALPSVCRLAHPELDHPAKHHVQSQVRSFKEFMAQASCSKDTLVSLFKNAVKSHPSAAAIESASFSMTYAELDRASDRVAVHMLTEMDLRRGLVALFFPRSVFMIIAMLGTLKAGLAYCPIEWDAPPARVARLLRQLNVSTIVSNNHGFEMLSSLDAVIEAINVDRIMALGIHPPTARPKTALPSIISPDSTCYVMLTSGSTGTPKPAILTHRAVTSAVQQAVKAYALGPSSRVLLCANYIFDASATDIYGSLITGATLVLRSDNELRTDLAATVLAYRINWLHVTPTVFKFMSPSAAYGLRTVVLGGEMLHRSLVRSLTAHVPLVIGAYGPTETAIQVLISPVAGARGGDDDDVVVYDALPGNLVVLADQQGELCYINEPGEILVAGVQVFAGYEGEVASASQEYFIELRDFPGLKFYRTGDLARWLPDMRIQILGRRDAQLKVAGMRIHPAEIETVLESHPDVLRASVASCNGRLCAMVQAKDSTSPSLEGRDLAAFCRTILPGRLVPSFISSVDRLPVLPSQKIDRAKVLAMVEQHLARDGASAADSRHLSRAEAALWSLVLQVTSASSGASVPDPNTALSDHGVDSLGFIQLRGILARDFGVVASYSELRKKGTIRSIAALIPSDRIPQEKSTSTRQTPADMQVLAHNEDRQKAKRLGSFPALPSQRTAWVAQQSLRDSRYNVQRVAEIRNFHGSRVLDGLMKVVSAVDLFRTVFKFDAKHCCLQQVLLSQPNVSVEYTVIREGEDPMSIIRETISSDTFVFDLEKGPMAKWKVFEAPENGTPRVFLYSNIHHILVDAHTTHQLGQPLGQAMQDQPLRLPTTHAVDLALELQKREIQQAKDMDRWKFTLRGARKFETTFLLLIHHYTGSDDVTITTPVSSRGSVPEFSTVLGNLTNAVFLRSQIFPTDTVESFARRVCAAIEFAIEANQPLEAVASACGLVLRDHSVQFVLHDERRTRCDGYVTDISVETLQSFTQSSKPKVNLAWHVFVRDETSFELLIEYETTQHNQAWIQSAADVYKTLVERLASAEFAQHHPSSVLAELKELVALEPESSRHSTHSDQEPLSASSSWSSNDGQIQTPSQSCMSWESVNHEHDNDDDIRNKCSDETQVPPTSQAVKNGHDFEVLLTKTLQETLGAPTIDPEKPFHELGLDSFGAMAFISNIYEVAPELEINIGDIMEHQTIQNLARWLAGSMDESATEAGEDQKHSQRAPHQDTCPDDQQRQIAPASHIQRLFYLLQEQLGDTTYSVPALYRVHEIPIVAVLAAAQAIANTHDVFRTTFDVEDDEIVQVVNANPDHKYSLCDFSSRPDLAVSIQEMRRICHQDCGTLFDLTTGPLVRFHGFLLPDRSQFFFVNFHHIIVDEQSLGCFIKHVEAVATGRQSVHEAIPKASYLDVTRRQNKVLQDPAHLAKATDFWRRALSDDKSHVAWGGVDTKDPSLSIFQPAKFVKRAMTLGGDSAGWAYPLGATSFGAHLFALQLLLALRKGNSTNTMLIPATCRNPRFGEQDMYGSFVNTLPVPLELHRDQDLRENLARFNRTLGGVLSYAHIPSQMIMDMSGRKFGQFDMMFVYHESCAPSESSRRTEPKRRPKLERAMEMLPASPPTTAKFPVTLNLNKVFNSEECTTLLQIYVEYNPGLIDEASAALFCRQFERLLGLLNGRDTAALSISSLSAVLDDASSPAVPPHFHGRVDTALARENFIDVQILEQAERTPEALAAVFENDVARATYRELADMVYNARHIISSAKGGGIAHCTSLRGKRIAVVGDVSIERLAVLIAVMSLGAAYIPIDLANPLDWNKTIVKDCDPCCMVFMPEEAGSQREDSSANLWSYMGESVPTCTRVRIPAGLHACGPFKNRNMLFPVQDRSDDDIAYVLYTSGSTGVPKGVPIKHGGLKNSVAEHRRCCMFSTATRLLGVAPWTFDVSVVDMFGPLSIGAQLVLGRRDYILSDLTGVVQYHSVSHISTTPTVASLLDPDEVPTIKSLALGGEPMTKATRDAWAPRIMLLNVYGPTEATVDVITRRCYPDTPISNIGRPLANVQAYILDDSAELQQVPAGEVGQLALGGVQVSPGYLRDPPGRPCPFIQHPKYGPLYLTGDLASFEPDGTIVCKGRMDNMINLRGLRVELGAVESVAEEVLVGRTGAGKCVTSKLLKNGSAQEVLVALFCAAEDTTTADADTRIKIGTVTARQTVTAKQQELVSEMKAAVLKKLPKYFLPDYWVPVDGFPRNKNQKLDRKQVQAFVNGLSDVQLEAWHLDNYASAGRHLMEQQGGEATMAKPPSPQPLSGRTIASTSTSPRSASTDLVIAAFEKILGAGKAIDAETNFFAVGGDSISVIRLCTALRAAVVAAGLGKITLRVRDIYAVPTPEELAGIIDKQTGKNVDSGGRQLKKPTPPDTFPITPIMDYFLRTGRANINWFNQGHAFQLAPGLTFDDFLAAWRRVVKMHPMLRMRLVTPPGQDPKALAKLSIAEAEDANVKISRRVLGSLADLESETHIMQGSLDIEHGPISGIVGEFRDGSRVYCSAVVHHMAIDVVSWHIVCEDMENLLHRREPEPEVSSFKDWAEELFSRRPSHLIESCDIRSRTGFNLFVEDISCLEKNTHATGFFLNVKAPLHVVQAAEKYGVDTVDMILATLVCALGRWRDMDGVQLVFESHGRELSHEKLDLASTVGWFTYMIPILFQLPDPSSVSIPKYLAHVHETRVGSMARADFAEPILPVGGCSSQEPECLAVLNYLGHNTSGSADRALRRANEVNMGSWEDPLNKRPFVFEFESSIDDDCVNLGVFFSRAIHTEADMHKLLSLWDSTLREFATGSWIVDGLLDKAPQPRWIPQELRPHRDALEAALRKHKIQPSQVERLVPATNIQAAMVLASLGSRSYMHSYDYDVEVPDSKKLCAAWAAIFRRHSIFRTVFLPVARSVPAAPSTNLLQVVLKADSVADDQIVAIGPPPPKMRAAYGQILSKIFLYQVDGKKRITWFCHHAYMDQWSRSIVFKDLEAFYRGSLPITCPAPQFADVAQHQSSVAGQVSQAEHLEFWTRYLKDVEDGGILVDHSIDPVMQKQLAEDRHQKVRLDLDLQRLVGVAAQRRTSVLNIVRASWALVLAAYGSSQDVVFGTVSAGRGIDVPGVDVAGVVGPLLGTSLLRVKVDWTTTVDEFVDAVTDTCMDVAEHELGLSLRKILAAGTAGRKGPGGALFNTSIMMPVVGKPRLANQGEEKPREQESFKMTARDRDEVTDMPLIVTVEPGVSVPKTTVISGRMHGRDFDDKYIGRLLRSLGCVLSSFATALDYNNSTGAQKIPERTAMRLCDIDLLDKEHATQIEQYATGPEYPPDAELTCWDILDMRARKSPRSVAIEFHTAKAKGKARTITYSALHELAEKGAAGLALQTSTLGKTLHGERVALYLDKSIETVATIFAAHRLCATYVPLDIESPPSRIRDLVGSIRPAAVVCELKDKQLLSDLVGSETTVVTIQDIFGGTAGGAAGSKGRLESTRPKLDEVAAILFTSGSTGLPKGVLMPHRQAAGFGVMMASALQYRTSDRVFAFARMLFDVALTDIFGTFYAGATLLLAPHAECVSRLLPLLQSTRATCVFCTPSVAGLLPGPDRTPLLRCMWIAGERATEAVIKKWTCPRRDASKQAVRLVNGYGPTEGVVITWKLCRPDTDGSCVGRPAMGMKVRILDEYMRPVPIGTKGLIWCSGRQLSLGYFGRKDATDAVFRPDPWNAGNELIYNTGDIGAYNADGELLYFSRNDRQVKIHGQRTELGEIESLLGSNDEQVVVILFNNGQGNNNSPRLIGFHAANSPARDHTVDGACEVKEDTSPIGQARTQMLQARARDKLAPFMVPNMLIAITAMPLNSNGKVDQSKLKSFYAARQGASPSSVNLPSPSTIEAHKPGSKDLEYPTPPDDALADCLVHFRSRKSSGPTQQRTIYGLFAVTGLSRQYRAIAERLTPDFNLVGVDNIFRDQPTHYPSIAGAMAADHAAAILHHRRSLGKENDPEPVLLFGYSFSGTLAWEIARELLGRGHRVQIVMVDADARPRPPKDYEQFPDEALERYLELPSEETIKQIRALEIDEGDEMAVHRRNVLSQSRHNMRLCDECVPGPMGSGCKVCLVKLCCNPSSSQGTAAPSAAARDNCGGECASPNGFDKFIPSMRVRCLQAIDHYRMLSDDSSIKAIAKVLMELFG
ncbi:NRPS [Pyricularia oryzae]|nr:NRPS [Pyricularia oryzae]